MFEFIKRYAKWLHTGWPAGKVETLPIVGENGATNLKRVQIVGDLAGVPLLKFSSQTATQAVHAIVSDPAFSRGQNEFDLVIAGGGVAGVSAAIEARKAGLKFVVFEAAQPFATIANFPSAKPIFTYPEAMILRGGLQFAGKTKEKLLEEIEQQRRAHGIEISEGKVERVLERGNAVEVTCSGRPPLRATRVIIAVGRSGNFRRLGCPGEDLPKVFNRLHDPKDFAGKPTLVVGGGDSALETAIALAVSGSRVTLSYRGKEFTRPKPENIAGAQRLAVTPALNEKVADPSDGRALPGITHDLKAGAGGGSLALALQTTLRRIDPTTVDLAGANCDEQRLPNEAVFVMTGREAPLEFLRRCGVRLRGEWNAWSYLTFGLFFVFCCFLFLWKGGSDLNHLFEQRQWFPFNVPGLFNRLPHAFAEQGANPATFLGTLKLSSSDPGFYYSVVYSLLVVVFGLRRMTRRKTMYIRRQTWTLMITQVVPLFLLPFLILPWLGHNGWFDGGWGKLAADQLFPIVHYGQGREYWRAFGLILAWPLFIWNLFTDQPLWWWLVISVLQTGVIIPLIVRRWGKGAYCGWICSCGALAETLGDGHRRKMPHGAVYNRLNMVGQAILAVALLLLLLRVVSWLLPGLGLQGIFYGLLSNWKLLGIQLNYYQVVDTFLAGTVGVGLYFWFSGRVWCRFACPLAALMHIYARFTRFRIFPEKKKCISCNVCTSVCHQGIDVMSFANKGIPMADPQCVRCSACVQLCPTGVLSFGRYGADGRILLDRLSASPVQSAEAN